MQDGSAVKCKSEFIFIEIMVVPVFWIKIDKHNFVKVFLVFFFELFEVKEFDFTQQFVPFRR